MGISKNELLVQFIRMIKDEERDQEANHILADKLLLDLIDDPVITAAFHAIEKWYA